MQYKNQIVSMLMFFLLVKIAVSTAEWKRIGLEGMEVTAIDAGYISDDSMIVAGTNGEGIFGCYTNKSTAMPLYSFPLDTFESYIRTIYSVCLPENKEIVFAGSETGLYYYELLSNSAAWIKINEIPDLPVTSITQVDDTLFASTTQKIYRSNEGKEKWEALNTGSFLPEGQQLPSFTSLTVDMYNRQHIYAGSEFNGSFSSWYGVLASLDMGDNWAAMNEGLPNEMISVYTINIYRQRWDSPVSYICGTEEGIYFRGETDTSWSSFDPAGINKYKINDLHVTFYSKSTISEIFACTDSGVYLLSERLTGSSDWQLSLEKKAFCTKSYTINDPLEWFAGASDGLYKFVKEEMPIFYNWEIVEISRSPISIIYDQHKIIIYNNLNYDNKAQFYLFDSIGKVVRRIKTDTGNSVAFKTEGMTHGIYFLQVKTDENYYTRKIIIINRLF